MLRYFFHLKDGRESLDDLGSECADIHAARDQAVKYSGEILRDGVAASLWSGEPWQLWVSDRPDGKGTTFFTRSS